MADDSNRDESVYEEEEEIDESVRNASYELYCVD